MQTSDFVTIAVLAGGQSRRMGRDKAGVELDGQALLDRVIAAGLAAGGEVLVVGRPAPAGGGPHGVRWVVDDAPGQGPLGGLATALELERRPVLLLGCDMPLVDARAIDWLVDRWSAAARAGCRDGLTTVGPRGVEPLFTIYTPSVLARVYARLVAGQRSVSRLIADGSFVACHAPDWLVERLVNVNTPEDLDRLQ